MSEQSKTWLSCWDRICLNHDRHADAALWVNMAAGLGMLLFHAVGIGPIWAGFLSGFIPAFVVGGLIAMIDDDEPKPKGGAR